MKLLTIPFILLSIQIPFNILRSINSPSISSQESLSVLRIKSIIKPLMHTALTGFYGTITAVSLCGCGLSGYNIWKQDKPLKNECGPFLIGALATWYFGKLSFRQAITTSEAFHEVLRTHYSTIPVRPAK